MNGICHKIHSKEDVILHGIEYSLLVQSCDVAFEVVVSAEWIDLVTLKVISAGVLTVHQFWNNYKEYISINIVLSIYFLFYLFYTSFKRTVHLGNSIFLLTGLRIYTGEYKAQGPTLCPTEGRTLRRPRALYSPV